MARRLVDPFAAVRAVGLTLPDVEAAIRYDGAPVLKMRGCFMAGLATHASAEPGTLVVRCGEEDRTLLLQDAPETYYLTDHYGKHPVVLVRLSRIGREALGDLLAVSWRLTAAKAPGARHRATRARIRMSFAETRARDWVGKALAVPEQLLR